VLIPRVPSPSSPGKGLYNPKAFVTHAASLDQACAHCPRFPTAASRRSLGRVSVPVWPIVLSDRLPIAGTVGRYPAVYLIGRGPIPGRVAPLALRPYPVSAAVSRGCPGPRGRFPRVTHPCAAVPRRGPRDLHVLSAPPAFVLSQDQTLSFSQTGRGSEDPGPAGTLACFETARPTTTAAGAGRDGTSPARPTKAAGREPTSSGRNRAAPTRAARPSLPRYSTMSKNGDRQPPPARLAARPGRVPGPGDAATEPKRHKAHVRSRRPEVKDRKTVIAPPLTAPTLT
jgi:hypothetical protein